MPIDAFAVSVVAATALLAGTVKGVIGLGLPTLSLGVLTAVFDLHTAMVVMTVPSFVTNLWQAGVGGHGMQLLRRTWPFLLPATLFIWLGATALTRLDLAALSALLGALLIAYASLSLTGYRVRVPARAEIWAGPMFGIVNGLLTGMTGSFVVPGVMYLQAIGLTRDRLVQAMGILFTASTVALALTLHGNGIYSSSLGLLSAMAVLPALAGMVLGQKIRQRLTEALFRRVFFGALLALGLYIITSAVKSVL